MLPDVALIQMEEDGYAATLATTHDGMDARQNSMLSDAKSSQAMVNWCVVTLPHPAIMEYLLTRSEGSRSDARNLKLEMQIDEAALQAAGLSLDRRISFQVENVSLDELLNAAVKPAGLTAKRDGQKVRIAPAN